MRKLSMVACACALVLAGCGTSPTDRAVTGAGIGAAAGAVGAAIVDGHVGAGLLLGGIAGAAAGAATSPDHIDLGDPLYRR